jgi:hypothetical protein
MGLAAASIFGAHSTLAHLGSRAPGLVRAQIARLEQRLGVRIDVDSVKLHGWRSVAVRQVVVSPPIAGGQPLIAVSEVIATAGLTLNGWRPAIAVESIRVDGATLRVGGDLLRLLDRQSAGRRVRAIPRAVGSRANSVTAFRVPRIEVLDASLLVERPNGQTERWQVPLVTLSSDANGRLSGRAELDAGPGMPFSLELSGLATPNGLSLQVESPTMIRPPLIAEWLGRTAGFRAVQIDRDGLTLREVEFSVPSGQGMEVMARLPTLRVRVPSGDAPRLELHKPWLRLERYADGSHNLMDLLGMGRWNKAKITPSAGGEQESVELMRRPALRVTEGEVSLVSYSQGAAPTSVGLRRLDLRLSPTPDGYDASATWNPAKGAGVLSAAGRLVDEEDFDVRLDFERLDLSHLAAGGPAQIQAGRADGGIRVQGQGESVRATGQLRFDQLAVVWPLLSSHRLDHLNVLTDVDVHWDRVSGEVRLANLAATVGETEITAWGILSEAAHPERYDIHLVLGPAPCDDIVRSIPIGLRPELSDLVLEGHVTLRIRMRGRRDDAESLRLSVQSELDGFDVVSGGPDIAGLRGPFVHEVRLGDGVTVGRLISMDRSAPGFTAYADTPVFLRSAIVASEDVAFWRHNGFDLRQIGASLARNLKKGRIERGGSTVTQQLVKNLFLGSEKTLGRKLQEAFLTWRMEEELPKRRILEIYMNIVEWGPNVYGVREAAWHYFHKRPKHLSLKESAFLAAILPSPVLLGRPDPTGRPSPVTRRRIERIIRRMQLLGYVSEHAGRGAPPVRLRSSG